MKAWLVTWQWIGDHAQVGDPLVAILSSRKSDRAVSEFVEQYYLMASATAGEMAYYMNRRRKLPHKARTPEIINEIPHGGRIRCGADPYIYARLVTDLRIEELDDEDVEIITWREPSASQWKDGSKTEIELAWHGQQASLRRKRGPVLGL